MRTYIVHVSLMISATTLWPRLLLYHRTRKPKWYLRPEVLLKATLFQRLVRSVLGLQPRKPETLANRP